MTEKRFTDDGIEEIENQSFTDNLTGKTYWIDNGLDEIVDLLNALHEENEQLKQENKLKGDFRGFIAKDIQKTKEENEQLKASLYAEKTNTAEVINEYAKQFKRHSSQFSFMIDLAEDLGIDVNKLEALDD